MPGVGNRGGRAITRSPRVKTEELAEPPLQTKDTPAAEATTKDDGAGSLEDALAQLQMLKEDSAPESSESLEITEDNAFAVRRKHQMAQAMMHVIDFDPNWRKTVPGLQTRPLNQKHVSNLKEAFVKIRRTALSDQIVIGMSQDDLSAAISFTLEQMRGQEPETPYYTSEESLKAALFDIDKIYIDFASVPKLLWPSDRLERPELESGQHRREALIQSFGLSLDDGHPMRTLNSNNFMKTAWTVAICNIDTIDDEFFRAVRTNRADTYKSASEGDDFMTMIKTWLSYDVAVRNEKMNMKGSWTTWLNSEFGIETGKARRFMQLLRRRYWVDLAIQYNSFAWARETWKVQHFCDASAQGCDEVWGEMLTLTLKRVKAAFQDKAQMLTASDMDALAKLGNPQKVKNWVKTVQELFFPEKGGKTRGEQNPDVWYSDAKYNDCKLFSGAIRQNGKTFGFRRPYFLAVLTNAEYIAAEAHFESLQLSFPSHNTFASQITSIGPLMNTLLRFVIYFVNPVWKKVGNKSDGYIDFQWWRVIRDFYFPLPPVQDDLFGAVEGAISEEEYTARKARAEAKSKRFPLDLRAHLVTNKALWLKATKESLKEDDESLEPRMEDKNVREKFRMRFVEPSWNRFLHFVVDKLGSEHFTGVMTVFHTKPEILASLGTVLLPTVSEGRRLLERIKTTRYLSFPLLADSGTVADQFAKEQDVLLCFIELRECNRLRRNYEKIHHWQTEQNRDLKQFPFLEPPPIGKQHADAINALEKEEFSQANKFAYELAERLKLFNFIVDPTDFTDDPTWPCLHGHVEVTNTMDFESDYEVPAGVKKMPMTLTKKRKSRRGQQLSDDFFNSDADEAVELSPDTKHKKVKA